MGSTPISEPELRRELVRFSKWLSRLGFMPGTSGNLSARLDEGRLLVTPTGMSKLDLFSIFNGRGGQIRTDDPLLPKQVTDCELNY